MSAKYIEMGTCKRPHGIKGGFQFHLYNIEDSSIQNKTQLLLKPLDNSSSLKKEGEFFTVKSITFGNKTICYLNEVVDRSKVEQIVPFAIFLDRIHFSHTSEDEVYLSDLEGIDVLNTESEKIGMVKTFYDHGATAVLVIELLDGQKTELPFVEAFFPELNMEDEYIVMINPEEM